MHTIETENQFLQLRAQGHSLAHIATQINVAQRTLVDWNRKHHAEIQNLRAFALEALKEKVLTSQEQELTTLSNHLQRIEKELSQRPIRFVPVPSLFRVCAILRSKIRKITIPSDPFPPLDPLAAPTPPHQQNEPSISE